MRTFISTLSRHNETSAALNTRYQLSPHHSPLRYVTEEFITIVLVCYTQKVSDNHKAIRYIT